MILELGSLQSVAEACDKLQGRKIDYLLLNAGLAADFASTEPIWTKDGMERSVGVNHVAHCLLVAKVVPIMEETAASSPLEGITPTVTFVSSGLHNVHTREGGRHPQVLDETIESCQPRQRFFDVSKNL